MGLTDSFLVVDAHCDTLIRRQNKSDAVDPDASRPELPDRPAAPAARAASTACSAWSGTAISTPPYR